MNMLGCLDVPTSGEYFLNGTDVSTMEDNELSEVRNREIGFIFQGFNLISNLTAIENVELPLVYRGVDRKTRHKLAVESLTMVGLEKRMDHRPNEMSGGQQQRVAIARAIAAQPPVILPKHISRRSCTGTSRAAGNSTRAVSTARHSGETYTVSGSMSARRSAARPLTSSDRPWEEPMAKATSARPERGFC